jgi:2-C-methyl-D-erythritol 4-phosphate cytidylyltransferase
MPTLPTEDVAGAPAGGKRTIAVVLCAGQGTRLGAGQNKVFLPLAGRPIVVRAVAALAACPEVHGVLLVAHPREVAYCETEIVSRYGLSTVIGVVAGGASRHQSEERALAALRQQIEAGALDLLLIHDGARPFVAPDDVTRLIEAARATGGAVLASALAPDEVVARVAADSTLEAVYNSDELWRAQTPQAFAAAELLSAYDRAHADGFEGTDTAASFERLGRAVAIVPGSPDNFKITTPHDLQRAEQLVSSWPR